MSPSRSARELLAVPVENLKVSEAVVLDWYDGPIEGFLRFDVPPTTWGFKLFAERPETEIPDDRLFLLSEVPVALWKKLTVALTDEEGVSERIRIPSWNSGTTDARAAADKAVASLADSMSQPEFLVRLSDSMEIQALWAVRVKAN